MSIRGGRGLTIAQRTGFNQYHNYNVFKDNEHAMYTAGNGAVCKSIYYILIVSLPGVAEYDAWSANKL